MNKVIISAGRMFPRALRRKIKQSLINYFEVPTVEWSLTNLRRLGFKPAHILDIGAYKGEWTAVAHQIFPNAFILMLEAEEDRIPDLEAVKRLHAGKTDYRISLLGAEHREDVPFNKYPNAPTGNSVLTGWKDGNRFQVRRTMRTVDAVLAEAGQPSPDLMKLDVQGYELEVLKGAQKCLATTQAVILEVSFIEMYRHNPLIYDVVCFMRQRGFQAYDICGLMRRPLDMALAQIDMMFVPEKSPFLRNKQYGKGDAI